MIDKVQKIREEVARIQLYSQSEVLKQVLDYIDEVQKEPANMWHDASEEPKPNMELICVGQYGNPLVLSSNSDSFKSRDISKWAYFNDLLNLSNAQRTTKDCKEPVSEELEEAAKNVGQKYFPDEDNIWARPNYEAVKAECAFKAGAKWQKQQMMKDAVDGLVYAKRINGEVMLRSNYVKRKGLNFGDKVKVIVIKEE